jgi:PAS domain S-box-containing protein
MITPIANMRISDVMERDVLAVQKDCRLRDMVVRMKGRHVSHVVVLDADRPVGMLTERDLVRLLHRRIALNERVAEVMSSPLVLVPPLLGFRAAYVQLCLSRLRHLVIVDDSGQVLGVAAERDFLGHLGMELCQTVQQLSSLTDRSVPLMPAETPVSAAIDRMIAEKRGCIVVADKQRPLGIFTEHQAPSILAKHADGTDTTLAEVMMASAAIAIREDDSVSAAITRLVSTRIGYLVVVDAQGQAAGVIAQSRLMEDVRASIHAEIAARQLVEEQAKTTEQALAESNVVLKTIIDAVPMRIFWKDRELRYLGCNPPFARDAGKSSPAELLGKDDFAMGWAEEAELYRADDRKVIETGEFRLGYEEPQTTPDGKAIWLRTSKLPLRRANGEIMGVLGVYEDITKPHEDEAALRRSQAMLRDAQSVAHVGSWSLGIASARLEWSDETYRIFGIETDAPLTLDTFISIIHPEDQDRVMAAWNAAIGGTPYDIEHRILRAGETRWVHERARIEFDAAGQPILGIGTVQDITERKVAQLALDEERKVRETIMESIPGVFYAMDASGIFTFWSKSFEKVTGRSPEELGRLNVIDLFEEDDRTHVVERIRQVFEHGASTVDAFLVAKDGRRTPYHFTGRRIELHGQPILVGAGIDISTLKQAEEALRLLNAELETRVDQKTADLQQMHKRLLDTQFAMDSVGIGITWADFETGQFIYSNKFAAEFLGYSVDEYLQLRVPDIDPSFPRAAFDAIKARIRQEGRLQFETTQKTRNGLFLPVEMTIYYHAGAAGERPKFISFMSDIAQRKEAEHALLQAKEGADAANQAKSAFLANMSHEIRTPLNAILGLNHLMRDDSLTARQVERLEKMEIAGRHLLSIINDILDLSKIEAGRLELETDNFHLSAVLDNVASMIRESARGKGLILEIDPDGVPLWLRGDAIRLRQALLNFASNAVKFTEQGTISLRALLLEDDGNRLLCRFEVADSGIGLTPGQLDRLFQNFQQADESTARKYGGTGLGLALTKRLVELMGGKVGADSTAGDGSTFWFTVPLQRGHGPMPQPAVRNAAQSAEARLLSGHRGARILLAEDNPINTEVVLELLHAAGMDVAVAENGCEAVERVRHKRFDLILMDMQMPKMDGTEATRTILTMHEHAAIPIVALTANVFAEDRRACLDAGMVDMLTKPIDPATLYAALLKWLPQRTTSSDNLPLVAPPTRVPTTSDAKIIQRLRAQPGIDVDHGLKLLHGKTDRYIKLLRNLLLSQEHDWESLKLRLTTGDCVEAKRQIHSFKGAAGTLALTELATLATHLDALLGSTSGVETHSETIHALLDEIKSEMKILGNALSA